MAEERVIEIIVEDHIARVLLNRPAALNAINWAFIRQMDTAMEDLAGNHDIRVVYFEGSGEKAFSAGADLKERKDMPMADAAQLRKEMIAMFRKITDFPKPTIAAVRGYALAEDSSCAWHATSSSPTKPPSSD